MTTKRQVSPLLTIETDAFVEWYQQGVWWSMYGDEQGQGLVPDSYLVTNVKSCLERGYFDGQHDQCLTHLGFYLGMYHGGTLSPVTGKQRPNVTTLVALCNHEAIRGYYIGRESYFTEADLQERRYTESRFLDVVRDLVLESPLWTVEEADALWHYALGSILGQISGELFPLTEQDRRMWAEIARQHEEIYQQRRVSQERITEPLPFIAMLQRG